MNAVRILIVEDEDLQAQVLADQLVAMGYDVCAIEGTEMSAVATALDCRPEVMIVDVQLGAGSGISAVAEIRRNGFSVPHIFVSGDPQSVEALQANSVALLKPYRTSKLVRAIERLLDAPKAA